MTERDDFLAWVKSALYDAERALHDGWNHDAVASEKGLGAFTLVDAVLQPGGYAVEWDVSELGAGIYYLTLRSGAWEGLGRALVE